MANIAEVYIDGEILPEAYIWDDDGTSLYRVRKQIEAAGDFDRIRLWIFTPGGYCLEGWAIHDYLLSFGKPIDTVAFGQCASFGTVFHSMGEVREVSPNCSYIIHRPWDFVVGNDIQIDEFNALLKQETTKLFTCYSKSTGMTLDDLSAYIRDKDLSLTPQETVDKKFSTAIYQASTASASAVRASMANRSVKQPVYLMSLKDRKINPKAPKELTTTNNNTMAEKKRTLKEAVGGFLAFLNGTETKALDVPLKDGRKLVTNSTGDAPVVGDTAEIDGATAPDGDYATEDGEVITVKDGAITAIGEADTTDESADVSASSADQQPSSATVAALNQKIAALEKERDTLKATVDSQGQRLDEVERRAKAVFGQMTSQEVQTQANKQPKVNGTKAASEAQQSREEMFSKHLERFGVKKPD